MVVAVSPNFAEILGQENFDRLVAWRGGTMLYVPKSATPNHPIAQAIGLNAMARLCEWRGGSEIAIPRAAGSILDKRNQEIWETCGTITIAEIALRFGLSERQIRNILAVRKQKRSEAKNDHN